MLNWLTKSHAKFNLLGLCFLFGREEKQGIIFGHGHLDAAMEEEASTRAILLDCAISSALEISLQRTHLST